MRQEKNLTAKQEAFCQSIAGGSTQSDAYRKAYNVGKSTKNETIHKRASNLMRRGALIARVAELRAPSLAIVKITLDNHLKTLESLRDEAVASRQFGAAINAEQARGKASGLYTERHEVSGKDGGALKINVVNYNPA